MEEWDGNETGSASAGLVYALPWWCGVPLAAGLAWWSMGHDFSFLTACGVSYVAVTATHILLLSALGVYGRRAAMANRSKHR